MSSSRLLEQSHPRLRVGVIGVGDWGQNHAAVWSQIPGVQLLAVADRDGDRARAIAAQYEVPRWHLDHQALLADPEIDAVSVCTLETDHHRVALDAADAGKHILLEKPIATSLDEAKEIVSRTRERGVVLLVGHQARSDARHLAIRDWLDSGKTGRIIQILARRQTSTLGSSVADRISPTVVEGVHDADLVLWYTRDRPVEVYSRSVNVFGRRNPDIAWTMVQLSRGAMAVIESGWIMPAGHPTAQLRLEVFCEFGAAFLDRTLPLLVFSDGGHAHSPETHTSFEAGGRHWGALRAQAERFVECVVSGARLPIEPEEAVAALQLVLLAEESARTRQPVRVPDL